MVTPDVHEIPGLSGAKIGWRAWWATGGHLCPTEPLPTSAIWTPRRAAVATCLYGCTGLEVPKEGCVCGIAACKENTDLGRLNLGPIYERVRVIGEVALWGKIIEGERGWRAARAYPVRLYVPYPHGELATALHDAYGCHVELRNTYELEAA